MTSIVMLNKKLYVDKCTITANGFKLESKVNIVPSKEVLYVTTGTCITSGNKLSVINKLMRDIYASSVATNRGGAAWDLFVDMLRNEKRHRAVYVVGLAGIVLIEQTTENITMKFTKSEGIYDFWAGTGGAFLMEALQLMPKDVQRAFEITAHMDSMTSIAHEVYDIKKLLTKLKV